MGYQPLEELLPKTLNSIYTLVRLASDRAVQLADGKKAMIELPGVEKLATIALEEIRQAKVVWAGAAHNFKPEISAKGKQKEVSAKEEAVVE